MQDVEKFLTLKILFVFSVGLMFLHKLESYYTNEFNVCPVYYHIRLHITNKSISEANFKIFCFWFFSMLFLITSLIITDMQSLPYLFLLWIFMFIHEIHHPIQSFINKSYYSGSFTAWIYVFFGFGFCWNYFSFYIPNNTSLFMGIYTIFFTLYTAYLSFIPNNIIIKKYEDYNRIQIKTPQNLYSNKQLIGKTYVITGGNSPIGIELVKTFSKLGATVIIGYRNINSASKLCKEIKGNIIIHKLDLSNLYSVNDFVFNLPDKVDGLILNAGICSSKIVNEINTSYLVNYIGNKKLIELSLPHMKKGGKIINISSIAIFTRHSSPEKILEKNDFKKKNSGRLYGDSKFMLMRYLSSLCNTHHNLTFNSFHPGIIRSGIISWFFKKLCLLNSPTQIANVLGTFCCEEKYNKINDKFFNVDIEEEYEI